MEETIPSNEDVIDLLPFYVYELRDPRSNEVFYVGKGSGNRIYQHSAEEENDKGARIDEIRSAGFSETRIVVARCATEEAAFNIESVLIKWVYGFENLLNRVHGHHHMFVRPHQQKATANYSHLQGIDVPRKISGASDGSYTAEQRQKISENAIYEKLEALRVSLQEHKEFRDFQISEPDLSVPADPCLLIKGFQPSAVQLQLKMQLSGETVVLNLVPAERRLMREFESALKLIQTPFEIKKGNGRFGGMYTQTHDFKTKAGGYPKGIKFDDVETIARMALDAISRLQIKRSEQ